MSRKRLILTLLNESPISFLKRLPQVPRFKLIRDIISVAVHLSMYELTSNLSTHEQFHLTKAVHNVGPQSKLPQE